MDSFAAPEHFFRPLRVFAFDPSRGSRAGNFMTIRLPYEPLQRGPVGRRLAVVDYDAARDCFYPPVDLDDPLILQENGLEPRDSDPRFHQQMVYAVASQTLHTFDRALGREVRFRFQRSGGSNKRNQQHLRIFPHGMNEANAFYSRDLRALVFGYFSAEAEDAGPNIPGQPVFTCLSHDIIVHEMCHAIIDGMRGHFLEKTNRDSLAFHEALSDVIALLQHFTFPEPLLETIQRTGGRLHRSTLAPELSSDEDGVETGSGAIEANPLVDLALQFGESLGTRKALRSAIGVRPNKGDFEVVTEPHDRGAILVAAIFDAYFRVYTRRTRDLFRLADVAADYAGELHPDLANRLCSEATALASQFVQLCIRAVEFCPPVDLEFGDYLRALITVHCKLDVDDRDGFRDALIRAFGRRGIFPPDVRSMTESSLRWTPPAVRLYAPQALVDALREVDREDGSNQKKIAVLMHQFCEQNHDALGLTEGTIAVRSFHHAVRLLGAELEQAQEFVCEITQTKEVLPFPGSPEKIPLRGGTTLVVRNDGRIRYAIAKTLDAKRERAQLDYATGHEVGSADLYRGRVGVGELRALHRGY